MAQKDLPAVLIEIVGIVSSGPSIVVRQYTPRPTNDVANLIEILLERLEADDVVLDEAAILVIEDRVLRSRQMAIVMALAGQISKHVVQ